jgi:Trypsin-like serine proteases, typically periplasmic, contain C-terminal PDZ domain
VSTHERSQHLKKKRSAIRKGLLFFASLLIALISILYAVQPGITYAQANEAPGGNVSDARTCNVDLALPSVVRIFTATKGHISVQIASANVAFPLQNGQGYDLRVTGTGTFISAHGDILTADHVVKPATDKDLVTELYQVASSDIAAYLNANAKSGQAPTTAQNVQQQLTSGQLKSTTTFDTPQSTVYLSTAYSGKTGASTPTELPAGLVYNVDKIKQESPPDQADTAIIHIPLENSLSASIGASDGVQQQDQLTTIGFPGNSDVGNSPDSILTSSVNQVFVNAQKTGQQGNPLIQITGNISPGDSGGPALNEQGEIVGIVSFGVVSPTGTNNTSFLQASNSARTMIQNLKLDTTPGPQQKLWTQAFTSYAATIPGHWHTAEQQIAQLLQQYPNFKQVKEYYNYAQTQAKSEQVPAGSVTASTPKGNQQKAATSTFSWQALALLSGSIFVILLLAVGTFSTALRRKKQPARRKDIAGTATPKLRSAEEMKEAIVDEAPSRPVGTSATTSTISPAGGPASGNQATLALKIWPCGHMNRLNARFCSTCGEPAPE